MLVEKHKGKKEVADVLDISDYEMGNILDYTGDEGRDVELDDNKSKKSKTKSLEKI